MGTDLPEKPKLKDHLVMRDVNDELAIYDQKTAQFHFLNPTGAIILELCDSLNTVEDIVREISEIFNQSPAMVKEDVHRFLGSMAEKQLIV